MFILKPDRQKWKSTVSRATKCSNQIESNWSNNNDFEWRIKWKKKNTMRFAILGWRYMNRTVEIESMNWIKTEELKNMPIVENIFCVCAMLSREKNNNENSGTNRKKIQ